MRAIPSYRTSLAFLLIGALLVRVGWVLHLPVDEFSLKVLPDQVEYLELGKNLLQKHSLEFRDERFGQIVRAYRTPGYPLLVALCGASVRGVRLSQSLIDTSTVLAAYVLARRWLSPSRSLIAACVVAINPFLIYFTGLILSETLFIAMLAWGLAATVRCSTGLIVLALSILVRPSVLLLPVLLTVTQPRKLAIACVCIVVVLLPWAFRNHAVLDRWIWTTTNGGITQYDGFNPQADGASNQSFITKMPELSAMNEVERSTYLGKLARDYAIAHPLRVLQLAAMKIARTWSPIPLSSEYGSRWMYVAIAAVYSVPLGLLVLWGLWSGSLPCAAKVYLMIPALYLTAAHALSVGSLRYRIPAEVPMAVVASGVGCRVSGFGKRNFPPTRAPIPDTRNPM